MNKNKQIVPLCIIVAIAIFIAVLIGFIKTPFQDYNEAKSAAALASQNLAKQKEKYNEAEEKNKVEEMQLKAIKQLYISNVSNADNLSAFGTMFDDIIKRAQSAGILIRSIAYDLNPINDTIYTNHSDAYNVCELKLYFVGTYPQLQGFLNDMVNNYQYLISISKLSITSFSADPDYLLANISIILYSKKPNK